jgi:hypothetical protein
LISGLPARPANRQTTLLQITRFDLELWGERWSILLVDYFVTILIRIKIFSSAFINWNQSRSLNCKKCFIFVHESPCYEQSR